MDDSGSSTYIRLLYVAQNQCPTIEWATNSRKSLL